MFNKKSLSEWVDKVFVENTDIKVYYCGHRDWTAIEKYTSEGIDHLNVSGDNTQTFENEGYYTTTLLLYEDFVVFHEVRRNKYDNLEEVTDTAIPYSEIIRIEQDYEQYKSD